MWGWGVATKGVMFYSELLLPWRSNYFLSCIKSFIKYIFLCCETLLKHIRMGFFKNIFWIYFDCLKIISILKSTDLFENIHFKHLTAEYFTPIVNIYAYFDCAIVPGWLEQVLSWILSLGLYTPDIPFILRSGFILTTLP